jgi:hypothetical protein
VSTLDAPRPAPVRGPARLLRGWAAAAVATLLAAGSHTLAAAGGSGHHPPDAGPAPVVWILTLALAGPLCTALAGRPLSWLRLALAVGSSQLLFHWLYSIAAVPVPSPATAGPPAASSVSSLSSMYSLAGAYAGPGHAAHVLPPVLGTAGPLAAGTGWDGAETLSPPSLAMIAAHVLAAVGTVLVLRRGELLAVRVAELAVGLVLRGPAARLARWTPSVPVRGPLVRVEAPAWRREGFLLAGLRWRGPPEAVLAG